MCKEGQNCSNYAFNNHKDIPLQFYVKKCKYRNMTIEYPYPPASFKNIVGVRSWVFELALTNIRDKSTIIVLYFIITLLHWHIRNVTFILSAFVYKNYPSRLMRGFHSILF